MKLRDIIFNEVFDEEIPFSWIRQKDTWWSAEFSLVTKLGESRINVDIMKAGGAYNTRSPNIWAISFDTTAPGYGFGTYDIINSGKAYLIFGTVMKIINVWINNKNPDMFIFTADSPSRIKLYKRMIGKYLPNRWTSTVISLPYKHLFVAKNGQLGDDDLKVVHKYYID